MRLAPILVGTLLGALLALLPSTSLADATEPTKDLPGSSDPAWLKRFEGSFIISYEHRTFDAIDFPASKLVVDTSERRDAMNNQLAIAPRTVHAEGEYTRLLYIAPEQASPLEVIRNYINEIKANGGQLVYGCRDEGCGGSMEGNTHGGGTQGLLEQLYPSKRIKDADFSNGKCASGGDPTEQRYILAQLPDGSGGMRSVAVYTFGLEGDVYCTAQKDRTGVLVVAISPKPLQNKMVTVTSDEMKRALETAGHIALYGLYFDTNKSQVKPESKPTLEQIANLLKQMPNLRLGVVGHTDDVGDDASNLRLSQRRADAVVAALVEDYGIAESRLSPSGAGETKPVTPNTNDAGRAKNRRVELVKL